MGCLNNRYHLVRKLALISPVTIHESSITYNLISSIQKLHFSVISSNGSENIKKPQNHILLLQDPSKIRSLNEAKSFHALVITMGSCPTQEPVFLHNNIVSKYALFGDIYMARKVFDEMPHRNSISYNSMISSYSRDGNSHEVLELLSEMRECGFKPTQTTICSVLSCHSLDVFQGMQLHALIEKSGLLCADAFAGTALLGLYRRHGCLDQALGVFHDMPDKNLVTWNSMISVFGQMGYTNDCIILLSDLIMSPLGLSESTFVSVLSCLEQDDMQLGEQIHGFVIKYGFDNVSSVSNCLINMYTTFDKMHLSEKMFETASVKDIVSWNTLIGAMANSDRPIKAVDMFLRMCIMELSPNDTTFVNVLNACSKMQALSYGEFIHAIMIKKRFDFDVYTGSALVNFYAKCDQLHEARNCFDEITHKNIVCWNSLMMGYSNKGSSYSVSLLKEMVHSGCYPNEVSFSIVIKSSLATELRQVHSLSIKTGYQENAYVLSSLISSYARNSLVHDALIFRGPDMEKLNVVSSNTIAWIYNKTEQYDKTQDIYASVENPDVISWNILIAACSRNGDYKETFELFNYMRESQLNPDNYTFVSLFSVCTKLCNLALGGSLHALITKTDFSLCDTFLCNVIIDMYGKCGNVWGSIMIFNEMKNKNVITWTAVISALGLHGYANEALEMFREMEREGLGMDKVVFVAVLSACRHVGLVKTGMEIFGEMRVKYAVEPDIDHYLIMVDLLTRYGCLKEAEEFILGMPFAPNALIWRCFLEGCKKQRTIGGLVIA